MELRIADFVSSWPVSPFGGVDEAPWHVVAKAAPVVSAAMGLLGPDFEVANHVAVHRSARVEPGAAIDGPAIIGPGCRVSATALLRGGVYCEADCVIGPGAELKSSFLFRGARLAHFNFVGDSILGEAVNLEAGSVIANHRNEWADKTIRFAHDGRLIETGVEKFGALVGDGTVIGANAVIAPGAVIAPRTRIGRLELVDRGRE